MTIPTLEPLFLEILLRGLLLAGAGWIVGRCLRRGQHRWRHGLSLFFLAGLVLLPIAILAGWRWELSLSSWQPALSGRAMISGDAGATLWLGLLAGTWALGFGFQAVRLGLAHRGVARLKREAIAWKEADIVDELSQALGLRQRVGVAMSPGLSRPIVCGLWAPMILLPASAQGWTRNRLEWVIAHELAHVKRRDLWIQAGVQWLCALHWINPFAWMLARVVGREREVGADELALAVTGNDRAGYANDLLCLVQESRSAGASPPGGNRLAAAAMLGATSSKLEDRIRELLHADSRGTAWMKTLLATLMMAVVVWVSCCLVDPFAGLGPEAPDREAWMRLSADPFPAD